MSYGQLKRHGFLYSNDQDTVLNNNQKDAAEIQSVRVKIWVRMHFSEIIWN